jgi:3-hydroxyisobutyrate dehydrogenase-like beta-hydroxyacid dehydrogenase
VPVTVEVVGLGAMGSRIARPPAAAGIDLRLVPAARSWLAEAEAAGLGDLDYAAVLDRINR